MNSCVLSVHRFIYGIEYGQEMRLKNLEHHRFCHNHYSNVREQGRGQPHCRKLHLFTPSFQVTGSFSPTALNRAKNSNVLRRMAPSQSLSDHFRYAPREHTTFLHPYTTNNACSIRRGGCHECSFTSVAESHFRVRIVLKKKIAKISVSLDGTLEDRLIIFTMALWQFSKKSYCVLDLVHGPRLKSKKLTKCDTGRLPLIRIRFN